ncbi:uracil-DNA glycosylase-like [Apostichopus japonicus]|uniref:uracil-DNA glycosylase-like n=1 Tax=Stichopus japonicus TaxID=307972 RepID=UPI003AB3B8B4
MLGQSKLSAFFSPKANCKRTISSITTCTTSKNSANGDCDEDQENLPPKMPKTSHETQPQSLSPEQIQRMQAKKDAALQRLAAKNTTGIPEGINSSWAKALSNEFSKPYFLKLQDFVSKERQSYTIFPPPHQVYTWTQMCDIRDVKVVILGQDPYHNVRQAHGLCFSVPQGIQPPPSLQNMYKELAKDIKGFEHPGHGNLTGWAKQGVLLLNAVLTVRAHTPNSHKDKGWEKFTDAVINWLNKNQEKIVFMLWGSYAQKKGAIINTKRHCVLKSTHPSPLSAYRGFLGCGHFSKANEYLQKSEKKPIDWSSLND